ncbi:transposase [Streptomyces sp. R-74717]|uniref:transposase n=1 Tax=Streptomyces TaxID=1883 RepID=UPI003792427A
MREQFESAIRRFRTGSQRREMPLELGARQKVYDRFAQWRNAGVFQALMDGVIAEAAAGSWYQPATRQALSLTLPGNPRSPAVARAVVTAALRAHGLASYT